MKDFFAGVGMVTCAFFLLGALDVGNFVFRFSTEPIVCVTGAK